MRRSYTPEELKESLALTIATLMVDRGEIPADYRITRKDLLAGLKAYGEKAILLYYAIVPHLDAKNISFAHLPDEHVWTMCLYSACRNYALSIDGDTYSRMRLFTTDKGKQTYNRVTFYLINNLSIPTLQSCFQGSGLVKLEAPFF